MAMLQITYTVGGTKSIFELSNNSNRDQCKFIEDFDIQEDICTVLCDFDKFGVMQEKLGNMPIDITSADIQRIPNNTKNLNLDEALKIITIIEKFEENDDVQKVFHTLNVTEEIISELNN